MVRYGLNDADARWRVVVERSVRRVRRRMLGDLLIEARCGVVWYCGCLMLGAGLEDLGGRCSAWAMDLRNG
jgi:hypothetical protein